MREWASEMVAGNVDTIGAKAADLCTEFRIGMGTLLDLAEDDLHCCLKMYQPTGDEKQRELASWAVGHPRDGRPKRAPDSPSPETCSVHAALNGGYDGYTHWPRFTCFACNNLPKHAAKFRCPRSDWLKYYKSTLVFSIRFVRDSATELFDDVGYLAFDSPIIDAFADVPDIFEDSQRPEDYKRALNQAAAFHLGASYADAFATVMHGFYLPTRQEGARNAGPISVSIDKPVIRSISAPESTAGDRPGDPVRH